MYHKKVLVLKKPFPAIPQMRRRTEEVIVRGHLSYVMGQKAGGGNSNKKKIKGVPNLIFGALAAGGGEKIEFILLMWFMDGFCLL